MNGKNCCIARSKVHGSTTMINSNVYFTQTDKKLITHCINRIFNTITTKDLPQILSTVNYRGWLAIIQEIVIIRKLCLRGRKFVHFDLKFIVLCKKEKSIVKVSLCVISDNEWKMKNIRSLRARLPWNTKYNKKKDKRDSVDWVFA